MSKNTNGNGFPLWIWICGIVIIGFVSYKCSYDSAYEKAYRESYQRGFEIGYEQESQNRRQRAQYLEQQKQRDHETGMKIMDVLFGK